MNQLYLLMNPKAVRDTHMWATVTQVSPLRIRLDGESTALPFTPDTLISTGALSVNDRVRITFTTNDDSQFLGSRIVVQGRAGGITVVPSHTHTEFTTNAVPSYNGVSGVSTTSGSDTTSSASYVSMAGTGSQTSFSFTKRFGSSVSRIFIHIDQTLYFASGSFPVAALGALVNGSDVDLVKNTISVAAGTNQPFSGGNHVSGLAAGVYTIQARWRLAGGSGTLTRDGANWLSVYAMEVSV